jgi:hypothetical protein
MYILLDAGKDCDQLHDRENPPRQTKPQLSWLQPKSDHESWRGSVPRRTERLTVSCKVTLTLHAVSTDPADTWTGWWICNHYSWWGCGPAIVSAVMNIRVRCDTDHTHHPLEGRLMVGARVEVVGLWTPYCCLGILTRDRCVTICVVATRI